MGFIGFRAVEEVAWFWLFGRFKLLGLGVWELRAFGYRV